MTNREFYTAIASSTNLPAELIEFATAAIEKMDNANIKRKNTPSKTAIANEPLKAQLLNEILSLEPMPTNNVAAALGVSNQKASALLRQLVADGKVVAVDSKVPGKGKQKFYSLVDTDADNGAELE